MSKPRLEKVSERDPEQNSIDSRIASWTAVFQPSDAYQEYLVKEYVECTIEKERIREELKVTRTKLANRLETDWDSRRRIDVEMLANQLDRKPGLVREQLMMTTHGCGWMLNCWTRLLAKWNRDQKFDSKELGLAYDLLGIPHALRGYVEDFDVHNDLKARILEQIEALKDRMAARAGIDEIDKRAAISGQSMLLEKMDEIVDLNEKLEAAIKAERWFATRLNAVRRESKRTQTNETPSIKENGEVVEIQTPEPNIPAITGEVVTGEPIILEQSGILDELKHSSAIDVGRLMVDAMPTPLVDAIPTPDEPPRVVPQFPLATNIHPFAMQNVVCSPGEAKWVGHTRPLTT